MKMNARKFFPVNRSYTIKKNYVIITSLNLSNLVLFENFGLSGKIYAVPVININVSLSKNGTNLCQ